MRHPILEVVLELAWYVRQTKKYWLVPLLVLLLVASFAVALVPSAGLAPFLYALF